MPQKINKILKIKIKIFPKEWWLIRYNIFKKSLDLKTFNLHEKETFLSVDKESYSKDLIAYRLSRNIKANKTVDPEESTVVVLAVCSAIFEIKLWF